MTNITGIATQGHPKYNRWVKSYSVYHSNDGHDFQPYHQQVTNYNLLFEVLHSAIFSSYFRLPKCFSNNTCRVLFNIEIKINLIAVSNMRLPNILVSFVFVFVSLILPSIFCNLLYRVPSFLCFGKSDTLIIIRKPRDLL